MEAVGNDVYTEDIPLYNLAPARYLAIVQTAMLRLGWHITAISENAIQCYTAVDHSGAVIAIRIENGIPRLYSRSASGYAGGDQPNTANIASLKHAIAKLASEAHLADRSLHPMHREKYGALIPSNTYLVTPLLVYANTLVFLVMIASGVSFLSPTAHGLFDWGGNLRPAVTHGQWWRLGTYIFLHAGAMHLLMNTFGLLYIGMFLEPLLGKLRFAAAYLITGICAGLMSIAVHAASVGVGASGAIFGMYGVFLALLTTSYIQKTMRKTMLRSILFFILLNLLYGLQGNTDNAAHVGGLLSGIVVGYAYYPGILRQHAASRQWVTTAILAVLTISLVAASISFLG